MQRNSASRLAIIGAAVMASAPFWSFAQTSGSWIVNADGNWSAGANWNPAVPDGGGVATFNQLLNQNATRTITLDVPITLSGMVFNSAPRFVVPVTGANTLTVQGAGATPGSLTSNISAPNAPSTFSFGPTLLRPVGGANGITKTGPGNLTFQAANTYTGGTNFNQGMLLSTTGDGALGVGGAANAINMNGGIWAYATAAVTSARNVNLNSSGTFLTLAAGTFSGVFSGQGNFNKLFSASMAFQSANNYTGSTNIQAQGTASEWGQTAAGAVIFQANGTALNTSAITSGGTITLDNVATNINGRLNASAPLAFHAGGLAVTGNAAASTTEAVGNVTNDVGMAFFTVTPNAAQPAQLTMASYARGNRSTSVWRGTGLGNAPGNGVANIFVTGGLATTGGGGAAGSQNISIVQGAVGGNTATNLGTDLVTYGGTGVRPLSLAALEYRTALGAGAATDNVRLAAATVVGADETMNALVMNGALTGANTLTMTSGMLLNNTAATHTANFNFGGAEGVLHMTAAGTFGGAFGGSNGLTKSGASSGTFTGASTYSGPTTIVAGQFTFNAVAVPANAAGPFGNSDDAIIIEPGGSVTSRVWFGGTGGTTFDRDMIVRGAGSGTAGFGVTGSQTLTMNGDIVLERQLALEGSTTGLFTMNGKISGTGRLTDTFSSLTLLNTGNTFSGGIEMNTGSYYAGDNAAFGTGRIFAVGVGTLGASGAARTITNPLTILAATLNFGSAAFSGGNTLTLAGPVDLSGLASINFSVGTGLTGQIDGVMSNGAIVKVGAGTLRLTGANTYIGGTIVSAGKLLVSNTSGSGTGAGNVAVNAGTLGGNGSIAGAVTVAAGANLAPGESPGTLGTGALTLNGTSNLFWELDTAGIVGSGVNDLVVVNGNLVLDGVMTVIQLAGFGPGTYRLIDYSGTLTDNGLTLNPLAAPFNGSIDVSTPGQVNLVVLPEPGSLALAGGLLAVGLRRRRR